MTKDLLIQKYMAGTSTHEEEQTLRRLLREEHALTSEEQLIAAMLSMETDELKCCDAWMDEDESALFDEMMKEKLTNEDHGQATHEELPLSLAHPPRRIGRSVVRIMAMAAIATGIFYAASPLWKRSQSNVAVTYIYGEKMEDPEVALDMMQETMSDIFDRPDIETELSGILN